MEITLRNFIILLFLLTSLCLISCGGGGDVNVDFDGGNFPPFPDTDSEATDPFFIEVDAGNRSKVRLKGIRGKVIITGMSGINSVMISGIKLVGSDSTEDAEEHLPGLKVNVQSLEDEIFVETIQPQDFTRKYIVDYTITMPKDMKSQVTNSNGTVVLDSLDNDVTVNNKNGDVTLKGIVGSAFVTLTNGIIESEVTLPFNGTIDLKTVNGNINLAIPENTSAEFSASVTFGSISVLNLELQNEVSTSTSRSGTLGNGQGTISLEAEVTGDINVSGL